MSFEYEIENYVRVKTFASLIGGVSAEYVYKLERQGNISFEEIDGVKFVDKLKYGHFMSEKRRDAVTRKIKKIITRTNGL